MNTRVLSIGLLAGLALAGCADIKTTSGPPIAGSSTGPGSAPLKQEARDTMGGNSANASGGTATITGTRNTGDGGARPTIDYTGTPPTAGAGSATPVPLPTTGRRESNKGG